MYSILKCCIKLQIASVNSEIVQLGGMNRNKCTGQKILLWYKLKKLHKNKYSISEEIFLCWRLRRVTGSNHSHGQQSCSKTLYIPLPHPFWAMMAECNFIGKLIIAAKNWQEKNHCWIVQMGTRYVIQPPKLLKIKRTIRTKRTAEDVVAVTAAV